MTDFEGFPKIPRLSEKTEMIITEKLNGTNCQINITPAPDPTCEYIVQAGSRNRWINPGDDNFGFARWCADNREELCAALGEGRHFGEWCGPGIQKNNYGLKEKTLFLFNTSRWGDVALPCGIQVVPLLYSGPFSTAHIDFIMRELKDGGSRLGGKPEGVIIYLPQSRVSFKRTFEYEQGKWGPK
jgi:hypothetical protein